MGFMIALWKIDPYKQSLKVHKISLFVNNSIVLVFLIGINFVNYISDLNELIILILAIFINAGSFLSVGLAFVRLYYELKYGREL